LRGVTRGKGRAVRRFTQGLLLALAIGAVTNLMAGPAVADPANKNVLPLTFDCVRGTQTRHFVAVGIAQSQQISGQLISDTSVILLKRIVVDGQVVFAVPGWQGRPSLWTCTIQEFPGVVVEAAFTPLR
jgi:hypothetical protein